MQKQTYYSQRAKSLDKIQKYSSNNTNIQQNNNNNNNTKAFQKFYQNNIEQIIDNKYANISNRKHSISDKKSLQIQQSHLQIQIIEEKIENLKQQLQYKQNLQNQGSLSVQEQLILLEKYKSKNYNLDEIQQICGQIQHQIHLLEQQKRQIQANLNNFQENYNQILENQSQKSKNIENITKELQELHQKVTQKIENKQDQINQTRNKKYQLKEDFEGKIQQKEELISQLEELELVSEEVREQFPGEVDYITQYSKFQHTIKQYQTQIQSLQNQYDQIEKQKLHQQQQVLDGINNDILENQQQIQGIQGLKQEMFEKNGQILEFQEKSISNWVLGRLKIVQFDEFLMEISGLFNYSLQNQLKEKEFEQLLIEEQQIQENYQKKQQIIQDKFQLQQFKEKYQNKIQQIQQKKQAIQNQIQLQNQNGQNQGQLQDIDSILQQYIGNNQQFSELNFKAKQDLQDLVGGYLHTIKEQEEQIQVLDYQEKEFLRNLEEYQENYSLQEQTIQRIQEELDSFQLKIREKQGHIVGFQRELQEKNRILGEQLQVQAEKAFQDYLESQKGHFEMLYRTYGQKAAQRVKMEQKRKFVEILQENQSNIIKKYQKIQKRLGDLQDCTALKLGKDELFRIFQGEIDRSDRELEGFRKEKMGFMEDLQQICLKEEQYQVELRNIQYEIKMNVKNQFGDQEQEQETLKVQLDQIVNCIEENQKELRILQVFLAENQGNYAESSLNIQKDIKNLQQNIEELEIQKLELEQNYVENNILNEKFDIFQQKKDLFDSTVKSLHLKSTIKQNNNNNYISNSNIKSVQELSNQNTGKKYCKSRSMSQQSVFNGNGNGNGNSDCKVIQNLYTSQLRENSLQSHQKNSENKDFISSYRRISQEDKHLQKEISVIKDDINRSGQKDNYLRSMYESSQFLKVSEFQQNQLKQNIQNILQEKKNKENMDNIQQQNQNDIPQQRKNQCIGKYYKQQQKRNGRTQSAGFIGQKIGINNQKKIKILIDGCFVYKKSQSVSIKYPVFNPFNNFTGNYNVPGYQKKQIKLDMSKNKLDIKQQQYLSQSIYIDQIQKIQVGQSTLQLMQFQSKFNLRELSKEQKLELYRHLTGNQLQINNENGEEMDYFLEKNTYLEKVLKCDLYGFSVQMKQGKSEHFLVQGYEKFMQIQEGLNSLVLNKNKQ